MKKILFLIVIILVGCSESPNTTLQATENILPTNTEMILNTNTPTATSTLTPTFTLTNTPAPTSTRTPIPESLKEDIAQAYTAMIFIQTNLNLVLEVAERTFEGELAGFEQFGYIIGISALVQGIEEAIPKIDPPEELDNLWSESLEIHEITKEIMSKWLNEEIDSGVVMEELRDPITRSEEIMREVEESLSATYGFKESELSSIREEILESIDEIFATPTP